jgi:hypothetical protein
MFCYNKICVWCMLRACALPEPFPGQSPTVEKMQESMPPVKLARPPTATSNQPTGHRRVGSPHLRPHRPASTGASATTGRGTAAGGNLACHLLRLLFPFVPEQSSPHTDTPNATSTTAPPTAKASSSASPRRTEAQKPSLPVPSLLSFGARVLRRARRRRRRRRRVW